MRYQQISVATALIILTIFIQGCAVTKPANFTHFLTSEQLDPKATLFAKDAAKAIFTQWDEQALLKRASLKYRQAFQNTPGIRSAFANFASYYGSMKKEDSIAGSSIYAYASHAPTGQSNLYRIKAHFAKRPGIITLLVSKSRLGWQIDSYRVDDVP